MPAQGISFDAAKAYLAWLSRKVGRTYRLPSEVRARIFRPRRHHDAVLVRQTISPLDANYAASTPYANGPRGVDSKGPAVVDSYAPNPFGLYQVHGNVWEWTEDCFNKRYTEDTPTDGAPWLEGDCTRRMVRRHLELVRGQIALGLSRRRPRQRRRQQLSRGQDAERAGAVRT